MIKEHINKAFEFLGQMPVTGNNQELIVMAKAELRMAYKELEEENDESRTETSTV